MISQLAIFLLSTASIWLLSAAQPNLLLGYALGLASQPFWLYAAARSRQWGVFALSLIYVALWLRGIVNHWPT